MVPALALNNTQSLTGAIGLAPRSVTQLDGHPNQTMNCAPATMALIERYLGPELALSDRALVATLVRVAGTDRTGTGPDGIVRMVHGLGLNGAVLGDWRHLVQHLGSVQHVVRDRGWLALAAGNGFALPWNQRPGMVGGHAIALVGLDPAGNIKAEIEIPRRTSSCKTRATRLRYCGRSRRSSSRASLAGFAASIRTAAAACTSSGASRRYSTTQRIAPPSTAAPSFAVSFLTTPARGERSSFSIFMASTTMSPWPSLTS